MKANQSQELQFSLRKLIRAYWPHAKVYKWWAISIAVSIFAFIGGWTYSQFLTRDLINVITNAGAVREAQADTILWLMAMIIGLRVFGFLVRRWRDYAMIIFQTNTMQDIADYCFAYVHRHSTSFFSDNFAGALVKKVIRYAQSFEGLVDIFFYYFLPMTWEYVLILFIFFSVHLHFGLMMLAWTVLFVAFVLISAQFKSKYDIRESIASTKVSGTLADTIANTMTIKTFARLADEEQYFAKDTEVYKEATKTAWLFNYRIDMVQGVLLILFNSFIFWLFYTHWINGGLTPGDMVLLLSSQLQLDGRMWDLGSRLRKWYAQGAHAMEMYEILETPHEIQDQEGAKELEASEGAISFRDVTFRYKDGRPILEHFNLDIAPGEKVALVGHSGAGKSTITKLLLRFHEVNEGAITIDGQNIAEVTQDSLRRHIAYVAQDPILFHRSLSDNIRYGDPDATQTQVEHAAKLAHAHHFIKQTPKGYETHVGERGVKLSGGERQRVAIARAMLKKAPIIVLDEATSSLDSESEKHIQQALHNLMRGKTAVVIAHRLSTIMEMDRIVVMEEGRIVEQGSHQELLKQGGVYQKLWKLQSGEFLE